MSCFKWIASLLTCFNNFTLQNKFGHRRRRSQKWPKSRQMTPFKDPFFWIPFIFILKAPQHIALAFYSIAKLNLCPIALRHFFAIKKTLQATAFSVLTPGNWFCLLIKALQILRLEEKTLRFYLEWDRRYCHLKLTTFRRNDLNFVRPLYPLSLWTAPIYTLEGRTHSIVANLQYDLCQL